MDELLQTRQCDRILFAIDPRRNLKTTHKKNKKSMKLTNKKYDFQDIPFCCGSWDED
jgi:hypothetical protein